LSVSIQGDADPIMSYFQNVSLHEAFAKAGATDTLFTVPRAGLGNFNSEKRTETYCKIVDLIVKHGL